jgi:hypothetical protein
MSVTLNDIYSLVKDYSRNQNLDSSKFLRNVNMAVDFVFSHCGIPSQEKEYSFYFDEDQHTYSLPDDFGEPLMLRYDDDDLNEGARFSWKPPEFIYERVNLVTSDTRLYSHDSASGVWRLWVLAKNKVAPFLLDSFDNSSANWTASNDATNVKNDTNTYKEGCGSMSFDINVGLSGLNRATLTATPSAWDLFDFVDKGYFKVWLYLPNVTNFTSVTFKWGSDDSNYFSRTVTAQEDGTAFAVGWNKLNFIWSGATQVGSPDVYNIDYFKFDFDYDAAYTGGSNYRLDYLRIVSPDLMILNYYTRYKGTTVGGTNLYDFTALTDKFYFDDFDVAVRDLIALYTAVLINPQILVDNEHVKEQYEYFYKILTKKYPRKRMINLVAEPSLPKTD